MKIKKFNENKELDPFGEEKWDDKLPSENFNERGRCVNCGSYDLDYYDNEFYQEHVIFEYSCCDCDTSGEEIYSMNFARNQIKPQR